MDNEWWRAQLEVKTKELSLALLEAPIEYMDIAVKKRGDKVDTFKTETQRYKLK